ncbi:hypothetical protein [Actinokineospora fastidiosa]|uniref:Uncharacterized protein n=1 Tax=Actinokineospora fastidiosa TaxID=1816 RepID=A0A918GEY2_9PSEU|nr:hypothetical protein [Actinokineospora fastidiosa]GGS32281.1 hypothetical protein GCM10010171_27780 [Actinokineospora fastidiosa]
MSGLREITEVMLSQPGPHAPPSVVAAWYERKAALLDQLAEDGGPEAEWAKAQARVAREHARALWRPAA